VADEPANNALLRRPRLTLGSAGAISTGTAAALAKLTTTSYAVIISDPRRGADPHAGSTRLQARRAQKVDTLFMIFSPSWGTNPAPEPDPRAGKRPSAAEPRIDSRSIRC
jgi:hypothetical protein